MIEPLKRRKFLKFGAALPLALSTLRAGADTKQAAAPRRIIFICNSLGFYKPYFFPTEPGQLNSSRYLNEIKSPDDVTVFENLYHPGMETSNHDSEKSFLTGAPNPEASGFSNTISLDQVLAGELGSATRFPFLSFSIYDRGWGCSWNDRGAAIAPMHDEEKIFNMLFGPEDLRQRKRQIAGDRKVLASLQRDLAQLKHAGDNAHKIEHYQLLIRELKGQLAHTEFWLETEKPKVNNSLSLDRQFEFSTKIQNLFELAKLAFRTDSTRIITLSMDWIYGAIKVPGATGGWHTLSHHGWNAQALKRLSCIESEIMRRFNQFLLDLQAIPEPGGSLLDHTTVVMGSNFGDASNHTCHQLPIIVAGGGYKHQQHKTLKQPTPLCNLWLELLNAHNIDAGAFGNSDKNLKLLGV